MSTFVYFCLVVLRIVLDNQVCFQDLLLHHFLKFLYFRYDLLGKLVFYKSSNFARVFGHDLIIIVIIRITFNDLKRYASVDLLTLINLDGLDNIIVLRLFLSSNLDRSIWIILFLNEMVFLIWRNLIILSTCLFVIIIIIWITAVLWLLIWWNIYFFRPWVFWIANFLIVHALIQYLWVNYGWFLVQISVFNKVDKLIMVYILI